MESTVVSSARLPGGRSTAASGGSSCRCSLCIALGAVAVAVWPKKYLSQAAIGVQSPTLSADLLRGVSSMDPVERQRAIQQLLLSPTVLERVIREEKINRSKPADRRRAVAARQPRAEHRGPAAHRR